MWRIQLHLTEGQDRRLRALARSRRTTRAALLREGVELVLQQGGATEDDPLLLLIGQAGAGGIPDASETHDRLLGEAKLGRRR